MKKKPEVYNSHTDSRYSRLYEECLFLASCICFSLLHVVVMLQGLKLCLKQYSVSQLQAPTHCLNGTYCSRSHASSYRKFTPPKEGFVTTQQIVAKHCAWLVRESCYFQRSAHTHKAHCLYIYVCACVPTYTRLQKESQAVSRSHMLIAEQGGKNLVSITHDRFS